MKLAWKIFLSTITTLALVTSLGGYALISYNFDQSFQREVSRSFEDLIYVRFSLETAIVNLWSSNPEVSDELLISVARQLEENELYRSYTVSVSDEEYNLVYQNKQGDPINALVQEVQGSDRIYRLTQDSGYKINSACAISAGNRTVYLQISRDITDLFALKDRQVRLLTLFILGVLVIGGAGIFGVSLLITRPVRHLSAAARAIAGGAYEQRIRAAGNDEIAGLARDFNSMADSVEQNINALKETARRQEEFAANFAHELKTPLTSIIGYSDMLRSRELPPESIFSFANYIHSEGRRLESLSLKLMDLIVLGHQQFELRPVHCGTLLEETAAVFLPAAGQSQTKIEVEAEPGVVQAEPDLLKTMLYNLLDNARKACEQGCIRLKGRWDGGKYLLTVSDNGRGIPPEEMDKITEPFYMVDKSRARRQNGAGLGLSLCSEIARLHGSELEIQSEPGQGTRISIRLQKGVGR